MFREEVFKLGNATVFCKGHIFVFCLGGWQVNEELVGIEWF